MRVGDFPGLMRVIPRKVPRSVVEQFSGVSKSGVENFNNLDKLLFYKGWCRTASAT